MDLVQAPIHLSLLPERKKKERSRKRVRLVLSGSLLIAAGVIAVKVL